MKYSIDDITRPFRTLWKTTKRMYDYAMFGKSSWDFDAQSIEKYMEWKLKRIQKSMLNGYLARTSYLSNKQMKALSVSLKILKRINSDSPYDFLYKDFNKNWGELQFVKQQFFYKDHKRPISDYEAFYANAKDYKEQSQAEQESSLISDSVYRMEKRDRKLLYKLLSEYIPTWWD